MNNGTRNPAGQLIRSTGDVREVTYKYDPFGRRIERNWREYNSYNYVYTYLYDGDDVVMSWKKDASTGSTLEINHYVHGLGIDEHLAMTRGTTPYFYLADGNNNVLKIAKQDQSIAQTYTYDSYGVYTNGLTFDQPYQMAGRELDRDTYLYYNRARYYSPRSKRFISRDPIRFAGGDAVLYGYTGGNPVNFIDEAGESKRSVALGIASFGVNTVAPALVAISPHMAGLAKAAGIGLSMLSMTNAMFEHYVSKEMSLTDLKITIATESLNLMSLGVIAEIGVPGRVVADGMIGPALRGGGLVLTGKDIASASQETKRKKECK